MNTNSPSLSYAQRLQEFHERAHGRAIDEQLIQHVLAYDQQNPRGTSVLDFGCGGGQWLQYMLTVSSAYGLKTVLYGFDPLLKTRHENPGVTFLRNRPLQQYDIVVCSMVLGHVVDPRSTLLYLRNRLHEGSRLLLVTPSRLYEQAMYFRNRRSGYRSDPTLRHRWYGWQLRGLARNCGLCVRSQTPISRADYGLHESLLTVLERA